MIKTGGMLAGTLLALSTANLLLPCPVFGQTVNNDTTSLPLSTPVIENLPVFSILDLFDKALTSNPDLQAARLNIPVSEADVRVSKQALNPQLMGLGGWGSVTRRLGNPQQIGLTQVIETGGKHRYRIEVSQRSLSLVQRQLNALTWTIRCNVKQAFLDVLQAQENLKLLIKREALLDELVNIANKRYLAGLAPQTELLQAQLSRAQLTPKEMEQRGVLARKRAMLSGLLNNQLPALYMVDAHLPEISDAILKLNHLPGNTPVTTQLMSLVPIEQLLGMAEQHRQDLAALIQQQAVAQAQVKAAKALRIPDVQVSGGYLFVNSLGSLSSGVDYYSGWYTSLTVTVPVFHNHGAEVDKALRTTDQVAAQKTALQVSIRAMIAGTYETLKASAKSVGQYQASLLPQASEVLQKSRKSYRYGKTGILNVIVTEQTLSDIMQSYLDAVFSYYNAQQDLEQAVGVPIEDWS